MNCKFLMSIEKIDMSGVGSFRLWESLKWDKDNNKILEELTKRGHQPNSEWAEEMELSLT